MQDDALCDFTGWSHPPSQGATSRRLTSADLAHALNDKAANSDH